ncbi:hypothetical protein ABAC402_01170 [Asticcacaulis sp. AC402]|nr:hypothetical protein ABAC402_01170 [Asticcacaulis sp. AC402]
MALRCQRGANFFARAQKFETAAITKDAEPFAIAAGKSVNMT